MKKIAYIEIDTHAEIASDFMDLMSESRIFSVDYYFSERILKEVENKQRNIFLSDSSMILDQLKAQNYDGVIVGTVHRYFNTFLEITKNFPTSIIVHNINFSQISTRNLFGNICKGDFVYRLKLMLKEELFSAPKVYQNAKNLFVLDEEIASAQLKYLPLFYTRTDFNNSGKGCIVVIPGGVSQKRRDYKHVLDVIKKSSGAKNIEFVFLGKAKGGELEQVEKAASKFNIKYFTERVSQRDFEAWMKKADALWCPIQQKTEFFSQEEIYGKTKMTGNIGDAIKFGKVAVFPKNYTSKLEFIIPEKENIIEQFYELKNLKYDFQKEYSKNKVLERIERLLSELFI